MHATPPAFDLALEEERRLAMLHHDVAALERLLWEGVIYMHSTGGRDRKQSYIDKLTTGELKYLDIAFEALSAHPFAGGVIVTGQMSAAILKDGQQVPVRSLFMTVWAHEPNQGWRMCAHQGTPIQPPHPAT